MQSFCVSNIAKIGVSAEILRSGLTFILVSSVFDVAFVMLFVDEGNTRRFVELIVREGLLSLSDPAALLPFVDEGNSRKFVVLTEEAVHLQFF